MRLGCSALLAALVPFALADVKFTSVTGGDSMTVGTGATPITVEWADSGKAPSIAELQSYVLDLCAGTNDNFVPIKTITSKGSFAAGNVAMGIILPTDGGDTENAYFFRIVSTGTDEKTVTNFSPRFTLAGMTGSFPASIARDLRTAVVDTAGPDEGNDLEARQQVFGGVATAVDTTQTTDASYLVAYTAQTGLTRYAPMQGVPSSKITKSSTSMRYPTSSYSPFSTYASVATQVQTITLTQTFSVSSREATQSAAAMPSDDMAKFLARWKD